MLSHTLYRWGRFAARRPLAMIGSWLVVSVLVIGASGAFGQDLEDSFEVPGLDSQEAADLLTAARSDQVGLTAQVVLTPRDERASFFDAADARAALAKVQAAVADLPKVLDTTDPAGAAAAGPEAAASGAISPDGRVALIRVQYPVLEDLNKDDLENLKQLGAGAGAGSPLRIEMGGDLFFAFEEAATGIGELIGLVAAVIILLLAFGSLIAMGLPIGMAVFGLALGISSMSLITYLIDIPAWAPSLGTMIGIGVGIDYALFIVVRHREYLARGMTVQESAGRAVATAGQAVVFAGGTVVIAMLGLAVAGVPFVTAAGMAISVIVLIMVVASITLLPAFLGLAGHRINRLGLRRNHARRGATVGSGWQHWGEHVTRNAWAYAIGAAVLLLALAAPVTALHVGIPDDGALPETRTERRAYDLVADGFGAGINGPLVVAVDVSEDPTVVQPLLEAIEADEGIAAVAPPEVHAEGGVATLVAFPTTGPQDDATLDTIERLRANVLPAALDGTPRARPRRRPDGQLRRRRRPGPRSAAAVDRRRGPAVVPAPDPGLPVGGRAAQGGAAEPAQHRRLLRRDGHGVPVGLGRRPHRPRIDCADRLVHPDVHVRHPLRPLDGLRGVPALPGARGVRRHRRQRRLGRPRHRQHRPGDHVGRADHDLGLPRLRAR